MWDRQDEKLVIFKTEAVLSPQQIAQPVMTSKQIKIPDDKRVCYGHSPPISNRVVPRGPEFLLSSGHTGCFMKIVLHRGVLIDVFTKGTDPLKRLCKASFIV